MIDCKLSAWSPWSTCSASCGFGRKSRSRYIIQMPQNGGKACDKKLSRTQRCKDLPPCPPNSMAVDRNLSLQAPRGHQSNNHRHNMSSNKSRQHNHTSTTTTTTTSSSSLDDEDDSKFSRLRQSEAGNILFPLADSFKSNYGNNYDDSKQQQARLTRQELKLIGSTSFHIKNGYVYLISSNDSSSSDSNKL